ncbi:MULTISPECIES: efflux RND transporter permease subunit [Legionella]|uniref:HelA protein n=1 Tax=Legionella waltersii TaxID=66969 RepID=A0A0W1AM77_9GAMM|nr:MULTISPECIES: efflux RND transporter permease subunit [Legionella]KTD82475.1 HelA protein [Legionella waltersii]MCZ4798784.1 efflux RND transporter permease subunit [Legionella pneumophila]SNU96022.1 HelA protein [Legionella waltersii]
MTALWLQRHRISLLFLLALFALVGLYSALKLPVALFPNISFPRIAVNVNAGDRPVDKMIIEVTRPLEQAIRAEQGVLNIRSISSRGSAELSINFAWGTDMVTALLQIQSALNKVMPIMPAGTTFEARRMDPTVFPMLGLALTSNQYTLVALKDFADFKLIPLLSGISGIATIESLGGEKAEFQVLVDPAKLREKNITFDEVIKALAANNVVTAVGRIEDFYRLYLVLSDTRLHQLEDINQSVLRSGPNGVLLLDDVAQVIESTTPQWTRVTANGHDAVLVNIMQQLGANTVSIVNEVKTKLLAYHHQIPKSVEIKTYYDQAELVVASAVGVRDSIIIGALLAALILYLFLRNVRMTLIVALILPCVLATTCVLLHVFRMSFNIMTLGGMAAAVGLIIDDGVVLLEHIMRRLSEGFKNEPTSNPVLVASIQMLKPLVGSSLGTIVIFLPLAFIGGVTGGFFKALALTMACALTLSFFYVFLVVPLLGEKLLKPVDAQHLEQVGPYLSRLHQSYRQLMRRLLKSTYYLPTVIIGLIIMGYLAYTQVGTGFMPRMDEGGFILDYIAPPGTSLTETDRLLRKVESLITDIPEVDSYSRRTGLQLGGGISEANIGDFFIHLKPQPRRDIEEIMGELRTKIQLTIPGLEIETAQLMEDMIGDLTAVPQPIEIKLFGENQNKLRKVAKTIAKQLGTVPGVVEVKNGIVISGDAVTIKVDRVKAALLGLDSDTITRQIQTILMGNVVSQIQSGEKVIGIRVWTATDLHERIQQLKQLSLRNTAGHSIALSRVATINIDEGQAQVMRENQKNMVAVKARIEGRDMGSTMKDVNTMMEELDLPPGVYFEYGGLYQEQQKSFIDLMMVFIGALLLVILLLLFLYENVRIVLSILITTLLSLPGIFLGLWITNTELNISAMMGMTMIIGMVTEIAVFYFAELTSYSRHGKKELIASGVMRMRPILMTTIIAILSLMPLAIGIGTGSTMQKPLAIAIISGLLFAIPLVLLVMPLLYYRLTPQKRQLETPRIINTTERD